MNNTGIGWSALGGNTEGSYNVAVGYQAMSHCVTGTNNIAVGLYAGDSLNLSESNNIYIGNSGFAGESDAIRIGTSPVQTTCFIQGIDGATTGLPGTTVVVDGNGQLGTISSTRRVKHNIADMNDVSAAIYNLRPVTFAYNSDVSETEQYGLIAEEVDEVFPGIVIRDADGVPATVQYHILPVLLLNEVQKLCAKVENMNERLIALEEQN
jgi:hypothetical protein